jgi:hypothetical protein
VFERQLGAFTRLPLDLLQTADIFPTHVGYLDHDLPQRRRLDAFQGAGEVIAEDAEVLQHLSRDFRLIESDVRKVAAQSLNSTLQRAARSAPTKP